MVFNATFNNMWVMSWRSVSLVKETRIPREIHRPVASQCETLLHNVASSTHRLRGIRIQNVMTEMYDRFNMFIIKSYLLILLIELGQCTTINVDNY